MKKLWYLRGDKAGTFEDVNDDAEGQRLIDEGTAQEVDGVTPLRYDETHPHYGLDVEPKKKAPPKKKLHLKKKYPNKMMRTDDV